MRSAIAIGLALLMVAGGCGAKVEQPAQAQPEPVQAAAPTPPPIDFSPFEPVHRAAKTIEASIPVDLSQPDFQKLVQELSTEILLAKEKITTEKQREIYTKYQTALDAYRNANKCWKRRNEATETFDKIQPIYRQNLETMTIAQLNLTAYAGVPSMHNEWSAALSTRSSASKEIRVLYLPIFVLEKRLMPVRMVVHDDLFALFNVVDLDCPIPVTPFHGMDLALIDAGQVFLFDAQIATAEAYAVAHSDAKIDAALKDGRDRLVREQLNELKAVEKDLAPLAQSTFDEIWKGMLDAIREAEQANRDGGNVVADE